MQTLFDGGIAERTVKPEGIACSPYSVAASHGFCYLAPNSGRYHPGRKDVFLRQFFKNAALHGESIEVGYDVDKEEFVILPG